jgi:ATP-binding protein involved in chromosome partitioning
VVDADIYGHSVPAMLGVADTRPTQVEDLIMPVPTPSGVSVISIGMLKPRRDQVVAWRGPMLDRALVQMLADVFWGDLDVLLLDLPPGTGDIAISLGQHLPGAEVVVVTTPQEAAAEVAERAGTMASMLHQRVVGVVENMSYLACPHCAEDGKDHRLEVFGSGGGARVAGTLSARFGYDVPLLGQIPLDTSLREGGDAGKPIVDSDPTAPAAEALTHVAATLSGRGRGLAGMQLGLTPTSKF